MNLQELHQQHRDAQAQLADVQARLDVKKREFTDMTDRLFEQWKQDNAELWDEHDVAVDYAGKAETTLRETIKAAYAADPTKKAVAPGLSVRITKKPVYDAEQAFQWALKHQLALALDKKAFEIYAANDQATITFVTYEESVSAVIGK
mgnify:CR=1 FL=1